MTEEIKTDSEAADKALIDRITAGVTAGVSAAIPKITEQLNTHAPAAPAQVRTETPLVRPSEDELAEAAISGNKNEYARLLRLQRAADQQENSFALGRLAAQGGEAIGQSAKMLARQNLPLFKKYEKEIDALVEGNTPVGAIRNYDLYEGAYTIVRGRHADEEIEAAVEERIRKEREPAPDLIPDGRRMNSAPEPEPTQLSDVLAGNWTQEFREKSRRVGGRTEDEELRRLGYSGGFKQFLEERKSNEVLNEETNGSFGLDSDWVWTDKSKGEGHYVNR